MKRTIIRYYCDICRTEIEADSGGGGENYRGRHYGLCEECAIDHGIQRHRLTESDGFVIRIVQFPDELVEDDRWRDCPGLAPIPNPKSEI